MPATKMGNLALSFILELCALGALCYWGFHTGDSLPVQLLLGIGAPLLTAVFWGLFLAPKAVFPVKEPARLALKVLVFGVATVALVAAGQSTLGLVFAALVALNLFLAYAWKQ